MLELKAFDFNGGGACPTQFYWHNIDSTKWYYFRYRNGHWFLKEGPADIEDCDYDKYEVIYEGYEGDYLDGYCTYEEALEWLKLKGCVIIIVTKGEVDDIL